MTIILDDWKEVTTVTVADRVTIKLAGATYKIQEHNKGGLLLIKCHEDAEPINISLDTETRINVK